MPKYLLLGLVFLVSCGKGDVQDPGKTGIIRRYEPLMVEEGQNLKNLRDICQALSAKDDVLNILAQSGVEYTFSYQQRGCQESSLSSAKDIVTSIQKQDSSYIFSVKNGERFAFTDVETDNRGVLSLICQNIGYLMNPMQTSGTGAMWFTTVTSSEQCKADAKNLCVYVQTGSVFDGTDYMIHTHDWIKFSIAPERKGFFVERRLVTSAGCGSKQSMEMKAVLK